MIAENATVASPVPLRTRAAELPFCVEIDKVDPDAWTEVLAQFDDATLYQTAAYGAVRRGEGNVSHLVLKRGAEVAGCCQVTFRRLPAGMRVGYVVWGPLWRKKGVPSDPEVFRQLVRELKKEYALRRGCLLRISPNVAGEHKPVAKEILEREGFTLCDEISPYRTLRLDLSPSLEELRKNLLQKWRNCLNKAERNSLQVTEGTDGKLFETFLALSNEMLQRKRFTPGVDYQEYWRVQQALPAPQKMRVLVCEKDGEPHCATVCSAIGDSGIYLLGATGEKGLGPNGPYLLQWRMIQWFKESGVRWFDLGGIDPEGNPGVYDFKLGIAGRSGHVDETFVGEFQGCFGVKAQIARTALGLARRLKSR